MFYAYVMPPCSHSFIIVTDAGGSQAADGVICGICDFVCVSVCLCVGVKEKQLELTTPN